MHITLHKERRARFNPITLRLRATGMAWLFLSWWSIAHLPLIAQINKNDSLEIAAIISQSHEQLIKHKYPEANSIALQALDKSTKLAFKWGLIHSHLLIGQSQKSLSNYPTSLNHYLQALSEIQKQHDPQMLQWTNIKIGELFQEWGVPEKALPYYTAAFNNKTTKTNEQYASLVERMAEVNLRLNQKDAQK